MGREREREREREQVHGLQAIRSMGVDKALDRLVLCFVLRANMLATVDDEHAPAVDWSKTGRGTVDGT